MKCKRCRAEAVRGGLCQSCFHTARMVVYDAFFCGCCSAWMPMLDQQRYKGNKYYDMQTLRAYCVDCCKIVDGVNINPELVGVE